MDTKKRMKILHVIDSDGLYGAEIMLISLMDEQKNMGSIPVLGSIGQKGISEKIIETEAIKKGVDVRKFRMRNGLNFLGALKIIQFAKIGNFDLIHSHGYKGNILLGLIPKKLRKIPLIATLHGWTNTGYFNKMKVYEWLDRKSLNFIDSVVAVNKAILSNSKFNNYKCINREVINNGIPPIDFDKTFHSPSDPILRFCTNGFIIGSIGRLSPEKGYTVLIEAFHKLVKKGLEAKLVIIGEGTEKKTLENLITKLKIDEFVLLPGYREKARMYIPLFNLFTLSSLTEGLPITLLEAMQAGTPIVSTEVGGVPEVLDHGQAGILVKPSDAQALTDAFLLLYNNRELGESFQNKAREIVYSRYSSKNMAMQYQYVYEKVTKLN